MTNSQNLPSDTTALLDALGGEPLAGSGFEAEAPEPGFDQAQPSIDDVSSTFLKETSQEDKSYVGHQPGTTD
jgi:hypothetical protein